MIGITLTSEQIRNAPADVRRWVEREVMMSLGQQVAPENGSKARGEHLAICTEEEITAILAQIQGVLAAGARSKLGFVWLEPDDCGGSGKKR
jgi:hypothetical protein